MEEGAIRFGDSGNRGVEAEGRAEEEHDEERKEEERSSERGSRDAGRRGTHAARPNRGAAVAAGAVARDGLDRSSRIVPVKQGSKKSIRLLRFSSTFAEMVRPSDACTGTDAVSSCRSLF